MSSARTRILLASLGIFSAVLQLIATHWGLAGALTGGLLCGMIVLAGVRIFTHPHDQDYWPPLVAIAASLLGLIMGVTGAGDAYAPAAWAAPLCAALPFGIVALRNILRGALCQICGERLRGLLSFSCPRCRLIACENCWLFERGRCRLCDTNQVPLLPSDYNWWQDRFGSQTRGGRCALCLRATDWEVSHWPCGHCGNSQCRLCWDDNNGECSRCGWILPGLPSEINEYAVVGSYQKKSISQAGSHS
jgi:hypothetical protein